MQPWIIRFVALAILLASAALAWWHLRERRKHRRTDLAQGEYDYFRRQFRRRIQISAMLAILAVLLAVESWVEQPVPLAVVGAGMFILLLWIMLLAAMDALASRMHYSRLHSDYVVERAKLEAEARRLRGAGGNGKPRGNPTEPEDADTR